MNRIVYLDYAKVYGMLLVIFAHLYSNDSIERLYIYAFHMPFFFLVSGMLHKNNKLINIKKYAKTLLCPACFFIISFLVISSLLYYWKYWDFNAEWNIDSPDDLFGIFEYQIKYSVQGLLFCKNFVNRFCWFLIVLFFVKVLMDLYLYYKDVKKYKWGGVIVVSVLFILCCIFHKNVLWIGQTLMAFPFYYVGFLCKEKIEGLIINNNPILGILLCLFLTIGLTLLNGRVSMLGVTFGGNTLGPFKVIVFYLNGFIGSLLLLYLGSLVKHRLVWIEQLSSSLLSVLGLQMFFTQTWKFTIGWNQSWFLSVSVSFLILLVCCMMHSILVKFLPIFFGKK